MVNAYFDSNLKNTSKQIFDKLFSICDAIEKRNINEQARQELRVFLTDKLNTINNYEFDNPAVFLSFINQFLDFAHNIFLKYNVEDLEKLENEILKIVLTESLSISNSAYQILN